MNNSKTKKLCIASILCAVAVVGSMFAIPVFGSKCAPIQHMVSILCAVLLGPWYGVAVAFYSQSYSVIFMGIGSLMAFPGSMFGALLCGIVYWKSKSITFTLIAEVFGTSILGGLSAYPIAILINGCQCRKYCILCLYCSFFYFNFRWSDNFSICYRSFKKIRCIEYFYEI